MNKVKNALELALEALERVSIVNDECDFEVLSQLLVDDVEDAIKACEEALASFKQEQGEPVAWYHPENDKTYFTAYPSKDMIENGYWQPLYKKGTL